MCHVLAVCAPHRRGQGVHPQGGEKFVANFTGKSCKCTPRQRKSAIFLENWGDVGEGVVNLVLLACVLRVPTKKGRQLFDQEKCTPRKKILATPMVHRSEFSPNWCFWRRV